MDNLLKNFQISLSDKLNILSEHLSQRYNKTGNYYLSLAQRAANANNNKDLNDIANEILSSSGKIQDLAGFDYKEVLVLNEICLIANEIKTFSDQVDKIINK